MATLWRFLTLLALLGLSLALPSVDSAGAVDSRIDARDENTTVGGVECANDGPWGSADGRMLKQFADKYSSESGIAYPIYSGKQNRCYQLACLGNNSLPGIIWACLRERTLIRSGQRELISNKQMGQAAMQIYNSCPTYTGRAVFQGQSQNWDIIVSGHTCPEDDTLDLNDPYWRPS